MFMTWPVDPDALGESVEGLDSTYIERMPGLSKAGVSALVRSLFKAPDVAYISDGQVRSL
jgi:hypothetical protein